jgi:hypothetical protein
MSPFVTVHWVVVLVLTAGILFLLARAIIISVRAPTRRFRNPQNNYVETVSHPILWSLLFGVFYFAKKGLWLPAVLCVLLPPLWLVFPFMAGGMIARQYLRQGWIEE